MKAESERLNISARGGEDILLGILLGYYAAKFLSLQASDHP
jgi:hypothetical protein